MLLIFLTISSFIICTASVAILEELLDRPELQEAPIAVVERLRPVCTQIARDVRRAAQTRLAQPNNISQLGAVLQVYFSLKELPRAVWEYVDQQCAAATAKTKEIWNAQSLNALNEQVKKQQKDSRSVQKKFKQVRGDLCRDWAEHILELCQHVRSLEKVLNHKTDPVSRTVFIKVVSESPVPPEYQQSSKADKGFSIFDLFWGRFSNSLSTILDDLLSQPTLSDDIAALYPAVRAASLDLLGHLISHSVQLSQYTNMEEGGILGGSSILQDPFLNSDIGSENPQAASAVRWTVPSDVPTNNGTGRRFSTRSSMLGAPSAFSTSVLQNSPEWKTLQGSATSRGLFLLEEAFMQACEERLIAPLQYLFPENVTLGEDGVTISSGLSLLPSKYDLQRFDENIRQELSLSDPREGGGDLTLVSMIAQCVVSMISEFCLRAKKAMSGVDSVSGYLHASDWSMTDNLQHDRKVAVIMYTMGQYLTNAPDKTFVAPYRPAVLPQQIEASELCSQALGPAVTTINNTVEAVVLVPLCRALNLKISSVLARIHSGVYLTSGDDDDQSPSFVQKELTRIFETIADKHLSKFPPTYASVITSSVMAHTIYTFITTVSMVRPMSEYARLHITQDLADLEMALEQFASRTGLTLNHVENGKPYAELRAVRQMLYWTGLENKTRSAEEIAKSLLREVWLKDVRPSTVFHYLFSFGPSLLSAPHHVQRCTATEYVNILVTTDGSTNGEDASWMTIVSSCDSYQQRASAGASTNDGDSRVAQIVLSVGQELLRRR